jgi:hypothetical protein
LFAQPFISELVLAGGIAADLKVNGPDAFVERRLLPIMKLLASNDLAHQAVAALESSSVQREELACVLG